MINVYKIGLQWYTNTDRNGGLFEYDIIEKELSDIVTDKNVLVIVNGKLFNGEEDRLLEKMKYYDRTIFIATDIVAFDDNKHIIDASDYLFHQSPAILKQFYYKPQLYSYVPELFYKYVSAKTIGHNGKLIFGGGVRDNKGIIMNYLKAVPSTAYLKTSTEDNRIPYKEYLEELAKHSYSLVISRKQYQKLGWVTPRFVESIALGTLPICDCTYDKFKHFYCRDIVSDSIRLREIINDYEKSPQTYNLILDYYRDMVSKTADTFKHIVIKLVGGYEKCL